MNDQLPTGPEAVPAPPPAKHGWLNFAIDFGPLLVFFLTYKFTSGGSGAFAATTGAIKATVAFMVAIGLIFAVVGTVIALYAIEGAIVVAAWLVLLRLAQRSRSHAAGPARTSPLPS